MSFDAARALEESRRYCRMIDERNPRWVRVLFVASLGALLLVELDRRFYNLGEYTVAYINLNYLISASAAAFMIVRMYGARRGGKK